MTFLEFIQSDSFLELVCVVVCLLHSVISIINALLTRRKINKFCDKCYSPIIDGEEHECLTDDQLKALTVFVASLNSKKDKDNG